MNVGSIIVQVAADLQQLTSGLRTAARQVSQAARNMQSSFNNALDAMESQSQSTAGAIGRHFQEAGRIVSGILISQAFYNTMNDMEQATKSVFEYSMALEDAHVKWEMFLGSQQEAQKWIKTMQQFAQKTPFEFKTVEEGASRIRLMGVETKQVLPILETLGNAISLSGGDNQDLNDTIKALGQMYKAPKAQAEEMEQFIEHQIDASRYLREELGLTAGEVKNLGDTGISGKQAALAILQGLAKDKNFAGGMEKMSETTRGMLATIKELSLELAAGLSTEAFESLSGVIRNVRDRLEELMHAFEEGGIGGFFEELVPDHLEEDIRVIVAAIKDQIESLKSIWQSLSPAFESFRNSVVASLTVIVPIISALLKAFASLLQIIEPLMPLLGRLAFVIAGLSVALAAAAGIRALAAALALLWKTSLVAHAIRLLTGAIRGLFLAIAAANPVTLVIFAIGSALIYLAAQSKTVVTWFERMMARIMQFMGMDTSGILQPIDNDSDWGDYYDEMTQGLEDVFGDAKDAGEAVDDALGGAGKGAKKGAKEMKKFVAAFDELYQVPEENGDKDGSGPGGGGPGGGGPGGGGLPNSPKPTTPPSKGTDLPGMKWEAPELPPIDWTPWAIPPGLFTPMGAAIGTLKYWLKELAGIKLPSIGEILEGMAQGIDGAFDKLLGTVGNFAKEFSGSLSPKNLLGTIGDFAKEFSGVIAGLAPVFGPAGAFAGMVLGLPKYFEEAWEKTKNFPNRIKEAWENLKMPNLAPVFSKMFENIVIPDFAKIISGALDLKGIEIPDIGSLLSKAMDLKNFELPDFSSLFNGMWDGIKNGFTTFTNSMVSLWENHKVGVLAVVGGIIAGVLIYFFGLPAVLAGALAIVGRLIVGAFARLGPMILLGLRGLPSSLIRIWRSLPNGAKTAVDDAMKFIASIPGKVANWLTKVPGLLKGAFDKLPGNVQTVLTKVGEHFFKLPTTIWNFIKSIPGKLKDVVKNFPDDAKVAIDKGVTWIKGLPGRIVEAVKTAPSKLKDAVKNFANDAKVAIDGAINWIKGLPGRIAEGVKSAPGKLKEAVKSFPTEAKKAVDGAVNYFKELPGKIWDAIKSIPSKVKEAFSGIKVPKFSVGLDGVGVKWAPVAGFANGGIIGQDSIVRVGEKGKREAIIPLQNERAMAPFADAVAARLGGFGQQPNNNQGQVVIQAGIIVADERGLRELERRLERVRQGENARGVR